MVPVLCHYLDMYYTQLRAGNYNSIENNYLSYLYALREPRIFRDLLTHQKFAGSITGIDPFGRVKVQSGGAEKVYSLKEIAVILT
jgi:BirA family biotin operon repressor/biotin-[acetyl-CoA-carboxylase] ligase